MNKIKQKNKKLFTHNARRSALNARGFTLIELAMVLVVIGLLIALGASLIGPLTKRAKLIESREAVSQAKEAVFGWTVKNTYLPPDIVTAGGKNVDGFGKDLLYIRATEIDASGKNACRRIAADPNNKTTLNICRNGDCNTGLVRNIAFVIVSGAENYNIQTAAGTPTGCPSGETCVRIYEIGTPNIDDYPTDINRPEDYDDIVQYVSLDEIRTAMGCPQPLQIVSPTTIPQGEEDSFYSYSMQAIGGVPPYIWGDGSPPTELTNKGLALSTSGLISGTLNFNSSSSTGELANCTESISIPASEFVVTDSASGTYTSANPFTIPVRPKPLTIITQSIPSATEGSFYSAIITASGGRTPYSWNMSVSPSCPAGLTCSGNSISGTPNTGTAGTYTVTSTVNDTCTTNTKSFVLTINPSDGGTTTTTTTTTTTSTTTTTTTTLPPSPTCTLSASPGIVRYGETTQLTWSITNGPANGTFSPASGTCTSFSGSTGGSCTTGALTTAGANTFTLTLSPGGNTCQVTVYVGCQAYRVWNNAGATRDYMVDATCRNNISNNTEITTTTLRLNVGETITQYSNIGICSSPTGNSLTYDQAMNADIVINGGNGDCRVNFTGTDR